MIEYKDCNGSAISVGDRVYSIGFISAECHDEGIVMKISDDGVLIGWDSGVATVDPDGDGVRIGERPDVASAAISRLLTNDLSTDPVDGETGYDGVV